MRVRAAETRTGTCDNDRLAIEANCLALIVGGDALACLENGLEVTHSVSSIALWTERIPRGQSQGRLLGCTLR